MIGWALTAAVIGGATVGVGAFLAVREALPATPALGPALRRAHGPAAQPSTPTSRSALTRIAALVRPPARELALLDRTPEQYVLSLILSGLIGLALPPTLTVGLAAAGVGLPLVVPAAGGLACAGLMVLIAHRDVHDKAQQARREFRRSVCTYLDLVALQLAAAHGPVQALERAARTCQGWAFTRINDALIRAQAQNRFPWQELRETADRIGVPELGDVGAIMQSAGTEGAHVAATLHQHADSLRDQIRTDALARAEAVTGRLDMAGAALVFVLVAFLLYPFMTRV